jgi:hypothetical protein
VVAWVFLPLQNLEATTDAKKYIILPPGRQLLDRYDRYLWTFFDRSDTACAVASYHKPFHLASHRINPELSDIHTDDENHSQHHAQHVY